MAGSQAPSSCVKSTVDGVPRFIPVRPSSSSKFHPWPTKSWQFGGILYRYVHRHYHHRSQYFLRCTIPTPECPSSLHESSYHAQESPSPSASSRRIDLYDDRSTLAGSHTQSQSPPCSGSPSYRLSFASQSLTWSTHKRSTTRPSQSGSSLPIILWGSGL